MSHRTFLDRYYHTPRTTSEAHRFGYESGRTGFQRLSRKEFLSKPGDEPHPFPMSLWIAYKRGYAAGDARRKETDA